MPAIANGIPVRTRENAIIFGVPVISDKEIAEVSQCLQSRWIGLGSRVRRFEGEFADYKGAPYAAAVNSGTAALFISMAALGIGPGDEVIAPSMTFCSTVHSIVHCGATPVLADCERHTFNIDVESIARRITPRTKALVVVHLGGRPCEMEPIMAIARKHNLFVIEDCAHAIEAKYHGRSAGLWGDAGCFSFYATKNITTGDGGMVITRDRTLFRRIKILSMHGIVGDAWSRCSRRTHGYKVLGAGFKLNMTDMEAALGSAQLDQVESRWDRRWRLWQTYDRLLAGTPLGLPPAPGPDTRHACHLYSVLLPLERMTATRRKVAAALTAENIGTGIHYVPVHQLSYYRRKYRYQSSDFPNAEYLGARTLSLPLTADQTLDDVADVCYAVRRILRYYDETTGGSSGSSRGQRATAG